MARLSTQLFLFLFAVYALAAVAAGARGGWDLTIWTRLRPIAAMWLFVPIDQFALGLLYFKMRDAWFGAFGNPKSRPKVLFFELLIALVALGSVFGYFAIAYASLPRALNTLHFCAFAACLATFVLTAHARANGLTEIHDTLWACLDLSQRPGTPRARAGESGLDPA
jgi:ATP-dependent Clp protease ATP-binding subunit ClpC